MKITCMLAAMLSIVAVSAPALAAPVCIQANRIDTTETPNDNTIIFKMLDHSVYRATMLDSCTGLSSDTRGFTYEPNPGTNEICANMLTIRLNTYKSICELGALEKIKGEH